MSKDTDLEVVAGCGCLTFFVVLFGAVVLIGSLWIIKTIWNWL